MAEKFKLLFHVNFDKKHRKLLDEGIPLLENELDLFFMMKKLRQLPIGEKDKVVSIKLEKEK